MGTGVRKRLSLTKVKDQTKYRVLRRPDQRCLVLGGGAANFTLRDCKYYHQGEIRLAFGLCFDLARTLPLDANTSENS